MMTEKERSWMDNEFEAKEKLMAMLKNFDLSSFGEDGRLTLHLVGGMQHHLPTKGLEIMSHDNTPWIVFIHVGNKLPYEKVVYGVVASDVSSFAFVKPFELKAPDLPNIALEGVAIDGHSGSIPAPDLPPVRVGGMPFTSPFSSGFGVSEQPPDVMTRVTVKFANKDDPMNFTCPPWKIAVMPGQSFFLVMECEKEMRFFPVTFIQEIHVEPMETEEGPISPAE